MSKVNSFLAGDSRSAKVCYVFGWTIVAGITRLVTRADVIGKENIPKTGAFVLAPVHRSYVDTPLAALVTRRRMRFMGKDSMWKFKPVGWVLSALGAFPVSRGTADREALKRCINVLEQGQPVVLFPEGERKSGDVVQPLYDGAAFVALKAGVPIIPVGIGGSEKVMPKDARFIRFSKCHIVIGEPITTTADESGRIPRSTVKEVTDKLHSELQLLFDQASKK